MTVWITIAISLGVLLIATLGALGARAAFSANRNTQTITNYEKSLASWEARATSAEADGELKTRQVEACHNELIALQGRFAVLQDMVTGHSAVQRMTTEISQYFAEMLGRMELMEEQMRRALGDQLPPRSPRSPRRQIPVEPAEPADGIERGGTGE